MTALSATPEIPDKEPTEFLGWPPNRATVMAISAFVANQRMVLRRVQAGERITLTQRNKRVAVLVPVPLEASRTSERVPREELLK